jgi:hypothetical protein
LHLSDRVELPAAGIDIDQPERSLVVQALERTGWNQTRASALLWSPESAIPPKSSMLTGIPVVLLVDR